jgi:hypothetical protein
MNITKLGTFIGDWSNINDTLLQQLSNLIKLRNCNINLDRQKPNQVSTFIKDNLEHYNLDQPFTVKRICIHLTDWYQDIFIALMMLIIPTGKQGKCMVLIGIILLMLVQTQEIVTELYYNLLEYQQKNLMNSWPD